MSPSGATRGLVVAGTDGSRTSLAAVELAAYEARLRGAALRVVHAFFLPSTDVLAGQVLAGQSPMMPPEEQDVLQEVADRVAAEGVERVREVEPEVEVTGVVERGHPTTVLEEQSHDADLVVVGSRGLGGFIGLLLGSTAVSLAAHGRCPLIVVREPPETTATGSGAAAGARAAYGPDAGPVVVGVDGSPAGDRAVEFAFAEAELRGAGLLALHAFTHWSASLPKPEDHGKPYAYAPGVLEENERRVLASGISGHQERHPDVAVERRLANDNTRKVLLQASESAQLVVVGARGRGGFKGLLLGSVSQAMLHHAHCPVAVVRDTD